MKQTASGLYTALDVLERQRKHLLGKYKQYNRIHLLSFILLIAWGVYYFFNKTNSLWSLVAIGLCALVFGLSYFKNKQIFQIYTKFLTEQYLPKLLQQNDPSAAYLSPEKFPKVKVPSLLDDPKLELQGVNHYFCGQIDKLSYFFADLCIIEWNENRRRQSKTRFKGIFIRIEGCLHASQLLEEESIQEQVDQLGKIWGFGANLRLNNEGALLLYIYSERPFWDKRPNQHIGKKDLIKLFDDEIRPIFSFLNYLGRKK